MRTETTIGLGVCVAAMAQLLLACQIDATPDGVTLNADQAATPTTSTVADGGEPGPAAGTRSVQGTEGCLNYTFSTAEAGFTPGQVTKFAFEFLNVCDLDVTLNGQISLEVTGVEGNTVRRPRGAAAPFQATLPPGGTLSLAQLGRTLFLFPDEDAELSALLGPAAVEVRASFSGEGIGTRYTGPFESEPITLDWTALPQ